MKKQSLTTKKSGFSLIEVMFLFTVMALLLSALVPLITRKSSPIPTKISHGVYRCISPSGMYTYDYPELNGKSYNGHDFVQEWYSGTRKVSSEYVSECSFRVPKAAVYKVDMYTAGSGGTVNAEIITHKNDSRRGKYGVGLNGFVADSSSSSSSSDIVYSDIYSHEHPYDFDDNALKNLFYGTQVMRSNYTGNASKGGDAGFLYWSPYKNTKCAANVNKHDDAIHALEEAKNKADEELSGDPNSEYSKTKNDYEEIAFDLINNVLSHYVAIRDYMGSSDTSGTIYYYNEKLSQLSTAKTFAKNFLKDPCEATYEEFKAYKNNPMFTRTSTPSIDGIPTGFPIGWPIILSYLAEVSSYELAVGEDYNLVGDISTLYDDDSEAYYNKLVGSSEGKNFFEQFLDGNDSSKPVEDGNGAKGFEKYVEQKMIEKQKLVKEHIDYLAENYFDDSYKYDSAGSVYTASIPYSNIRTALFDKTDSSYYKEYNPNVGEDLSSTYDKYRAKLAQLANVEDGYVGDRMSELEELQEKLDTLSEAVKEKYKIDELEKIVEDYSDEKYMENALQVIIDKKREVIGDYYGDGEQTEFRTYDDRKSYDKLSDTELQFVDFCKDRFPFYYMELKEDSSTGGLKWVETEDEEIKKQFPISYITAQNSKGDIDKSYVDQSGGAGGQGRFEILTYTITRVETDNYRKYLYGIVNGPAVPGDTNYAITPVVCTSHTADKPIASGSCKAYYGPDIKYEGGYKIYGYSGELELFASGNSYGPDAKEAISDYEHRGESGSPFKKLYKSIDGNDGYYLQAGDGKNFGYNKDGSVMEYPYTAWKIPFPNNGGKGTVEGIDTSNYISLIKKFPKGGKGGKLKIIDDNDETYSPVGILSAESSSSVDAPVSHSDEWFLENVFKNNYDFSNKVIREGGAQAANGDDAEFYDDITITPKGKSDYRISIKSRVKKPEEVISRTPMLKVASDLWSKTYYLGPAGNQGNSSHTVESSLGTNCRITMSNGGDSYDETNPNYAKFLNEMQAELATTLTCTDRDGQVVYDKRLEGPNYNTGVREWPEKFYWHKTVNSDGKFEPIKFWYNPIGEPEDHVQWKPTSIWAKVYGLMFKDGSYDLFSYYHVGEAGHGTQIVDKCVVPRGTTTWDMVYEDLQYKPDKVIGTTGGIKLREISTSELTVDQGGDKGTAISRKGSYTYNGVTDSGVNCYGVPPTDTESVTGKITISTELVDHSSGGTSTHGYKGDSYVETGAGFSGSVYSLNAGNGAGGAVVITW